MEAAGMEALGVAVVMAAAVAVPVALVGQAEPAGVAEAVAVLLSRLLKNALFPPLKKTYRKRSSGRQPCRLQIPWLLQPCPSHRRKYSFHGPGRFRRR